MLRLRYLLFTFVLFASQAHADIIIPTNADWKYNDAGLNQGTIWRTPTFNDTSWATGMAELGYGDAPTTNHHPQP